MAVINNEIFYGIVLVLIAPWLYDRYLAVRLILSNLPKNFTPENSFKSFESIHTSQIRNCEDVLLNEGMGIAILSCDPGRDRWNTVMADETLSNGKLWLYDYSTTNPKGHNQLRALTFKNFPGENDFHPLGIELDPHTSELFVVNHAQSGSVIEIFKADLEAATLTHLQTFQHPLIHTPNSIHSLGDGKLFVTNDHYIRAAVSPLLSKIETFSGVPLGRVVYTDVRNPASTKVVASVSFANGIAMLNETTLAVASTGKPAIYFYNVKPDYSLQFIKYVRVPAAIDNLSVDSAGVLLMAGHPMVPATMKVAKGRPSCNKESEEEAEREACRCTAPGWVAEWTEEKGLRTLYKGWDFCTSTTAVRDRKRGVGFVSGLYAEGLMSFVE